MSQLQSPREMQEYEYHAAREEQKECFPKPSKKVPLMLASDEELILLDDPGLEKVKYILEGWTKYGAEFEKMGWPEQVERCFREKVKLISECSTPRFIVRKKS